MWLNGLFDFVTICSCMVTKSKAFRVEKKCLPEMSYRDRRAIAKNFNCGILQYTEIL